MKNMSTETWLPGTACEFLRRITYNTLTFTLSMLYRIDTHFLIKITDFGLSEDVFERNYFRQDSSSGEVVKLPIKWMAPESLSDGHFSEKSDVVRVIHRPIFLCVCVFVSSTVVIWGDNVGDFQWREGPIPRH